MASLFLLDGDVGFPINLAAKYKFTCVIKTISILSGVRLF
jgi:hypothetical protein